MLGAPQIGVRHSRRLAGLRKVTRQQWDTGQVWDDEIGVSASLAPKFAQYVEERWCRKSSTTYWVPAATLLAMRARTHSCAESPSVGSPAKPPALRPLSRQEPASALATLRRA